MQLLRESVECAQMRNKLFKPLFKRIIINFSRENEDYFNYHHSEKGFEKRTLLKRMTWIWNYEYSKILILIFYLRMTLVQALQLYQVPLPPRSPPSPPPPPQQYLPGIASTINHSKHKFYFYLKFKTKNSHIEKSLTVLKFEKVISDIDSDF